jgi:hypothetical protein
LQKEKRQTEIKINVVVLLSLSILSWIGALSGEKPNHDSVHAVLLDWPVREGKDELRTDQTDVSQDTFRSSLR